MPPAINRPRLQPELARAARSLMQDPIATGVACAITADRSAVDAELERVLATPDFARSARLSAFLRYVVRETLDGRGARLKAFAIAQDIFGRGETFDPQGDTIVRVEAGRLRRLLERYYLTAGRDDPVIIEIPKGGYAATFRYQAGMAVDESSDSAEAASTTTSKADGNVRRWSAALIAAATAFAVAVLAIIGWWLRAADEQAISPVASKSAVAKEKPFVAILPLIGRRASDGDESLASRLPDAVVTDLVRATSRFTVMAPSSSRRIDPDAIDLEQLRRDFGVSHVLRGTLETKADKVRVQVQLVDTATREAIWAERFDRHAGGLLALESELAEGIVTGLTGWIDARESERLRRSRTDNSEALAAFREAVRLYHPPSDPVRVDLARKLYERAADLDPHFADAYAGISETYSLGILFGHSQSPDEDLGKALAMGARAVKLDPEGGLGNAVLGTALVLAGQPDEGLGHARRAVALEPGNPLVHKWLAINLIRTNRAADALVPIEKALRLDPSEPRQAYLNLLGVALLTLRQTGEALEAFNRNRRRGGPYGPHMAALRAAAFGELGRDAEAREAVGLVIEAGKRFSAERWLEGWMPNEARRAQVLAQLYRLGLPRGP